MLLSALAFGLFSMTACTSGGSEGKNPATEIVLSEHERRISVGEEFTLTAAVSDNSPVTWVSSLESVATVTGGAVKGVSAGTAVITAIAGNAMDTCTVTVTGAQESGSLILSRTAASVKVDESLQLRATATGGAGVSWLSSDPAVAVVSGGVITGVSVGTAVIHAWTTDATAECVVTVREVSDTYKDDYTLVWNDEFSGSALDAEKWNYQTGTHDVYGDDTGAAFWGNNELQYYTEDAVTVQGGNLVVTATKENMPEGRGYSSGRILTRDKASWTYGYFEARMKLPTGDGMWPAFWMLPQPDGSGGNNTQNQYGWWASNGEIDIMEARGRVPGSVNQALHFGELNVSTMKTNTEILSRPIDEWHIYGLEWASDHISWFVDGLEVLRVESSEWYSAAAPDSETAPFDVDFYILFNLAVGGSYDGGIAPGGDFTSASMLVDYVRVYAANA